MTTIIIAIALQIVLIWLNSIFAGAEMAVVSASVPKLEKMAEDGNKGAKRLLALSSNTSSFLSTIQVAITLSALLGSAFAADSLSDPLAELITKSAQITDQALISVIDTGCVILITVLISFFSIVFGELVPKRLAMKNPEKTAIRVSLLLSFVSICFKPFVWILTKTTNGILRLHGINPNEQEGAVSEEELRLMLKSSSQSGEIEKSENEMIQNIFEFDDISVSEICTHRTNVTFLYLDDDYNEWKKIISSTRFGFFPVCRESTDDIVGVLSAKKFFRGDCRDIEAAMKKAVEKPFFVPEAIKADTLFEKMKETRNYFAIVVDEYGGTSGVITMHDLLEVLVGDLADKEDIEVVEITRISEDKWEILGSAPIDDVENALNIKLDAADFDTFGGYILGQLDVVPDDGTTLTLETQLLTIELKKIEDRRIEKAIVTKKPLDTEEE
ncbi:MAG: HlyC/CorC family transporter [Clostridia bacterium]|nr:HlyC/CorC family transporter [Clostridia bacterium]